MANRTQKDAKSIKGTNPQYLVEKIIRTRIYDCKYWKEQCFGLSSELLVDKAMELDSVGGVYGANVQPSNFLCLVLKMLQIQPSKDIIIEFIKNPDYKYVRVLGALYLRLVGNFLEVFNYLEPLYNDYRKLKMMNRNGELELSHVDEFVDLLLHDERVCDVILPRIQKRHVLEQTEQLEPRVSALDEDLEADEEDEEEEEEQEEEEEASPPPRRRSPSPHRDRDRDRDRDRGRHRSHSRSPRRRSRSRSPMMRRRRSHSRSPRRHRHRSPSPQRHGKRYSRSPSPHHWDRGGRGGWGDRVRERGRERDRDRDRDRERDREREREREERDREKERDREREREERDREKEREREKERRERERDREREKKSKEEEKSRGTKDKEKKKKKKKDKVSKKEMSKEDKEIQEQNELRAKLGLKPLRV